MKRQNTLVEDLKSYGFAHGAKFIKFKQTLYDQDDLEDIYEHNRWSFAAGDSTARVIYPEASLLGLPVELRLQILAHLLPDKDIIGPRSIQYRTRPKQSIALWKDALNGEWHGLKPRKQQNKFQEWEDDIRQCYSPLRKDLESCWPYIQRVNRQLYSEATQIMYGGRTFTAELQLDEFHLFSRQFQVGLYVRGLNMLESQVRHIDSLEITFNAEDKHCGRWHRVLNHDARDVYSPSFCSRLGCDRKRMDGIRNITAFLSQCVGLRCLHIDAQFGEYGYASARTASKRTISRMETKMLKLIEPFSIVRGLSWAKITVNNGDPRDLQHSGTEFISALDTIETDMIRAEPAPDRTDMPETKVAFDSIFSAHLQPRTLLKQRLNIDVDALAESCWQACDSGSSELVRTQYKILTRAWEEQKAVVESLLRQIGEGALDAPPALDAEDSDSEEDAFGQRRRGRKVTFKR